MELLLALALFGTPVELYKLSSDNGDDALMINRAIRDDSLCNPRAYPVITNTLNFTEGGCELDLGPGVYTVKTSIVVDRPNVVLNFKKSTEVRVKRGTVPAIIDNGGVEIHRGLWLAYVPPGTRTGTAIVPLFLGHATFRIYNSWFDGATGDDILLSADAPHYKTIGDMWRLYDSKLYNAMGSGLYVEGGDSNTGIAQGNLADGNCQAPDDKSGPRPLSLCAGFSDHSFLGNNYWGNQAQMSKVGYRSIESGARNLYLNNYSEGDEQCAVLSPMATWIGGVCGGIAKGSNYASIWADGVFRTAFARRGPWSVLDQVLGVVPTATVGHEIGETVTIYQPYAATGVCTTWRLLRVPGLPAPKWTCIHKF